MHFPVVVHKDVDSDYGVTVPDLPGCFSAGMTVEDALEQVVEAIELHIEGLLLDNLPIPNPKSIEYHYANPDYAGGTWAFVSVDPAFFSNLRSTLEQSRHSIQRGNGLEHNAFWHTVNQRYGDGEEE